ncbi:MAG: hypothetical protein V4580_16755 [Bacteroidota bacterium]
MRNEKKIAFNLFSLLVLFLISGNGFAQQNIFYTEPVFDPTPDKTPVYIRYNFKELDDKDLYANSLKNIHWFSEFKSPPFKIENAAYYNPSLQFNIIDSFIRKKRIDINALHYYIDMKSVKQREGYVQVNTTLPYEYIYQPFYLLNGEVTNEEYREFVHYVRDSLARLLLAYSGIEKPYDYGKFNEKNHEMILKWDKKIPYGSDDEEVKMALASLYTTWSERFYSRPEIDARKLNYAYILIKDSVSGVMNVYPDTLVWIHDFNFGSEKYNLEPFCYMYFWHPAYDKYPVVGLTYSQIKIFLLWKTQHLQKEINEKHLPYIVEYDLPNELELEMISVTQKIANDNVAKISKYYMTNHESSRKYNLDLYLNSRTETYNGSKIEAGDHVQNELLTKNLVYKNKSYKTLLFPSQGNYKSPKNNRASLVNYTCLLDYGGIPFLNGNVSEWMHESFTKLDTSIYRQKNGSLYKTAYHRDRVSKTFPFTGNYEEDYILERQVNGLENDFDEIKYRFMDSGIVKNEVCKLVRGANWFDVGDWQTGHLKKTFVPKDSAHSTLGFRYVVRFKKK